MRCKEAAADQHNTCPTGTEDPITEGIGSTHDRTEIGSGTKYSILMPDTGSMGICGGVPTCNQIVPTKTVDDHPSKRIETVDDHLAECIKTVDDHLAECIKTAAARPAAGTRTTDGQPLFSAGIVVWRLLVCIDTVAGRLASCKEFIVSRLPVGTKIKDIRHARPPRIHHLNIHPTEPDDTLNPNAYPINYKNSNNLNPGILPKRRRIVYNKNKKKHKQLLRARVYLKKIRKLQTREAIKFRKGVEWVKPYIVAGALKIPRKVNRS